MTVSSNDKLATKEKRMSIALLEEWNDLTGARYGTEDKSVFLYALAKMSKPEAVLELGTGLAGTTLWLARALLENGSGHLYSVDNGAHWRDLAARVEAGVERDVAWWSTSRASTKFGDLFAPSTGAVGDHGRPLPDYRAWLSRVVERMGVSDRLTLLEGTLSLEDTRPVDVHTCPFLSPALSRPIDMLVADLAHGPEASLVLLTKYLPILAPSASIFLDSAATHRTTYLAVEATVAQLNCGKLPAIFFAGTTRAQQESLAHIVATRRFTLMHVVERKERAQNSFSWLKVEPVGILPHPIAATRAFRGTDAAVPGSAIEGFYRDGR